MNINPLVSADNPKATKSALESSAASARGDVVESEGFLSKLVSLVKGDSGKLDFAGVAKQPIDSEAKETSSSGEATSASELKSAENMAAGEMLADEVSPASDDEADQSVVGAETKAHDDAQQDSAKNAETIVADNQQVLKRLNEANSALQVNNGKALPQDFDAKNTEASVSGPTVSTQLAEHEITEPVVVQPQAAESNSPDGSEPQDPEFASVVVPESAKRFIETSPAVDTQEESADSVANASEAEGEVPLSAASLSAKQPVTINPATTKASNSDETTSAAEANLVTPSQSSDLIDEAESDATPETIQWAVNGVDSAPAQVKLSQAGASQPLIQTAAQTPLSQAQALVSQTAAVPVDVAEGSATALLNAGTSTVASTSTPVTSTANDHALLQATLGAKAAATLAGQSTDKPESSQGAESTFASQLAQAAGTQQSLATGNGIRAEQANAQLPLQLNRDMASDQMAERVQMMLSKNLKNIDIRLDPPELGRMQIRMNMNGDGATVHFTVSNQQARDALEQSMPRLREMLAQQGVQLGDTSVQQQSSNQQQNRYAAGGQSQSGQGGSNQSVLGEENLEADINLDLNVAAKRDGISYYA